MSPTLIANILSYPCDRHPAFWS